MFFSDDGAHYLLPFELYPPDIEPLEDLPLDSMQVHLMHLVLIYLRFHWLTCPSHPLSEKLVLSRTWVQLKQIGQVLFLLRLFIHTQPFFEKVAKIFLVVQLQSIFFIISNLLLLVLKLEPAKNYFKFLSPFPFWCNFFEILPQKPKLVKKYLQFFEAFFCHTLIDLVLDNWNFVFSYSLFDWFFSQGSEDFEFLLIYPLLLELCSYLKILLEDVKGFKHVVLCKFSLGFCSYFLENFCRHFWQIFSPNFSIIIKSVRYRQFLIFHCLCVDS